MSKQSMLLLIRVLLFAFLIVTVVACDSRRKRKVPVASLEQVSNFIKIGFSEADFLKEQQGTWVCYKYTKENVENVFDENYAKEFMKYAWFEISGNTMCANEIYKMEIYAYRYSTNLTKYNDESVFIAALDPKVDSLTFIAPYDSYESYWETDAANIPYYVDSPVIKTQLFWEDNFITHDSRGYFFYFKKDTVEHDHIVIGMPGDERNYFRVEKLYKDTTMEKLLEDLKADFPYGYHEVMNESNIEEHFFNPDWTKKNEIRLEKSQSLGKFVITIRSEDEGFRVHYYNTDDMENGDEDYQG